MSAPKVSVIIPAYQVTRYIAQTLDSVLAQTYTDFETIVVNDGCPDTAALEAVLQPYLPRLRYSKQENRGLSGARNTAIRMARGEFIALLDSDDLWMPQFLEQQMRFLEAHPSLGMVWCDSIHFGGTAWDGRRFSEAFPSSRPVTLEKLLLCECVPIASCVVVRRQAVLDAGEFDENLRRVEDFDMWVRLAYAGVQMDFQSQALGRRRVWPGALSANSNAQYETAIQVYRKFQAQIGPGHALNALIEKQIRRFRSYPEETLAREHLDAGRVTEARQALRRANAQCPRASRTLLIALLRLCPGMTMHLRILRQRLMHAWRRRMRSAAQSEHVSGPESPSTYNRKDVHA